MKTIFLLLKFEIHRFYVTMHNLKSVYEIEHSFSVCMSYEITLWNFGMWCVQNS